MVVMAAQLKLMSFLSTTAPGRVQRRGSFPKLYSSTVTTWYVGGMDSSQNVLRTVYQFMEFISSSKATTNTQQKESLLQVVHAEQHLLYDLNNVLNGIGGSLGLFLGMSLLGLVDWVAGEWRKRRKGKVIVTAQRSAVVFPKKNMFSVTFIFQLFFCSEIL